jgi:uncharacterized membrane protein
VKFTVIALVLHVLGACVWAGGHVVLALAVLPGAWRRRDVAAIRAFEAGFERVGLPAMAVQIATGAWLALRMLPDTAAWLDASNGLTRAIWLKLALLGLTVALAAHARLRLIPHLTASTVPALGLHIIAVTVLSLGFCIAGVTLRFGRV